VDVSSRLASGTPGLDELLGGGLLKRSITLVSGSAGIGKSTLGLQFLLEGAKRHEPGIYVTVEESEAQILSTADSLGLSLKDAIKQGLIEIIYLSRQRVRAAQFPAILTTKLLENGAQRLVLDSVSHIVADSAGENDNLRRLLYKLVGRFKSLGVTGILTLESPSMFSTEAITNRDFSPIADNLLMLRYVTLDNQLKPSLTIVKTRGSAHDRGTHFFDIRKGGMRIETFPSHTATKVVNNKRSSKRSRKT
jgi:circadian clock protein KaiC